jgi:hypothetical protein
MVKTGAVFNRLYSNGQKELRKREKVFNENKNVISSECTFSPTLSPVRQGQQLNSQDIQIGILKKTKVRLNVQDCLNAIIDTVEVVSSTINNTNQLRNKNGKPPSSRQYLDNYKLRLKEIYRGKQNKLNEQIKELQKERQASLSSHTNKKNSRFNRLYKDAAERRLKIDLAHLEKLNELPQEYTFKPVIYTNTKRNRNKIKYKLPGDKSNKCNSGRTPETVDERFARVIKRNQDYAERRKKFLNDKLKQKPHGCTFMPAVNKKYNGGSKKKTNSKKACLTLYYRGEEQRKLRNKQIKQEKVERDIRRRLQTTSVWGSPIISVEEALKNIKDNPKGDIQTNLKPSPPKTNKTPGTKVGGRAGKVTVAKNASKSQVIIGLNKGDDLQCTFKPRINNKKVSKREGGNKKIYDRLYKDGKEHLKRSLNREKANPTGCTFKPVIRASSSKNSNNSKDSNRFLSLYKENEVRLQRRDEAYSQLPPQCTFQPDISASNENGMGENADR